MGAHDEALVVAKDVAGTVLSRAVVLLSELSKLVRLREKQEKERVRAHAP